MAAEPGSPAAALVVTSAGAPPAWARALPDVRTWDPSSSDRALSAALAAASAVLIDGSLEAPLSVARRVRRLLPELQLVLVAEPGRSAELRRGMLFTPGLGEPWVMDPGDVDAGLIERAGGVARKRRTHARRLERMPDRMAELEPAPDRRHFLSDHYLATLLELLPEPVFALDQAGGILFANPAARSVFEVEGGVNGGLPDVLTALDPADPDRLAALLSSAAKSTERQTLRLRHRDGVERAYEVVTAPVASERPVRALVLHDTTEQTRLLEERDQALEEIHEVMAQRSRFYASMSHELRTPINAIIGYDELLLEGVFGEMTEEQRDALDRGARAARHLLELVNDVLDLSKLEAGKVEIETSEVLIEPLVRDLRATMDPFARSHDVELRFDFADSCAEAVHTDPRRLRQILMNLVSNAIRYGEARPVDIRCATDRGLRIEVEDRGPGLEAGQLDEIFDEFVQLQGGEEGGTGLGLSIARALARSLGGDITVRSEPGAGSTFTLELPPRPPGNPRRRHGTDAPGG